MIDVDAVVIGSGAGGMAAAVALARAGERVLVLEQHDRPGGWCHSFTLEGHTFSPGVHYVGDLGPEGKLRRVYEGLGVAGDMEWFELDPQGFDRVRLADSGFAFDIPRGREAFAEALARALPGEARATGLALERIAKIDAALSLIMKAKSPLDLLTLPVRGPALLRHGFGSLARLLDGAGVRDPRARAVLGIQGGDHGLPPSRVPAAVHAGVMAHYFGGGFYPRGGGFTIPRAFLRALRRAKGELRTSAPVARILVERRGVLRKRVAIGVRLASGEEVRARRVISNADPGVTFGRLVAPEHQPARTRRKLERSRWSISAASLFMALDVDPRALGLTSGNLWWSSTADLDGMNASPDLDGAPDALFVTATTLKDPTKRGDHTLEAFALLPWDLFAPWADSASGARPADYEALKARLEAWLRRGLARAVPGVERHITFSAVGTPLTNAHYVAATQGGLYGTEKTLDQIGPFAWGPGAPITNLWLCGASTLSHGVSGATFSGVAAAREALGCRTRDLMRDDQAPLRVHSAEDPSGWPDALVRDAAHRRDQVVVEPAPLR
jgi:phytoene dehydrogenase-like protein